MNARPTTLLRQLLDKHGCYAAARRWHVSYSQAKRLAQGVGAVGVGTALHIAKIEQQPVESLFVEAQ